MVMLILTTPASSSVCLNDSTLQHRLIVVGQLVLLKLTTLTRTHTILLALTFKKNIGKYLYLAAHVLSDSKAEYPGATIPDL